MECVERALKSSFRPEVLVKVAASHPQGHLLDDFWGSNGQAAVGGGSGDDFFVDDLLDFSKDDGFAEDVEIETAGENNRVVKVKEEEEEKSVIPAVTAVNLDGSVSVPESELCVPADDLEDLEWVSHFVDDSFPGYSLTYPAGKLPEPLLYKKPAEPVVVAIPVKNEPSYVTPVQTKARSKRARTGGRVWSLGSISLTDSSTSSSSSSCTSNPWLIYGGDFSQTAESLLNKQPPVKKPKKKKLANETGGGGQQGRRCSHCGVQKTPQWRTGPMGAKTLCNACGVRYKSGRLLPEYRPACSPTFSGEVHSNNHRKVLEMRRKKEVETGSGLPVQSF